MDAPTEDEVRRHIADLLELPESQVPPDAVLTDLVSESFRLVEMAIELQDDYQVILGQGDLKSLVTVGDLAGLVRARAAENATS